MTLVVFAAFAMFSCASGTRASDSADLTSSQITRFFNSYPAIHAMATNYWGARRHTPANKMLEPQGTFERAISEMEAAGTLPAFEILLQSYGYDDWAAWLQLGKRISHAYVILRLEEKDPAYLNRRRENRNYRLKAISDGRAKLQELPQGMRAKQAEMLRKIERNLEREFLAEHDAETLRPFESYFAVMDKYLLPNWP